VRSACGVTLEREAEAAGLRHHALEQREARVHDLDADAVAGEDHDAEVVHRMSALDRGIQSCWSR
jgi:hypothetical protein